MPITLFECAICAAGRSEQQGAVRTVGDDPICSECVPDVLALFEDALKSEINFPPRWGPEEISFDDFADLFSNDFRLAYLEKIKEYKTPIPKRVYCRHKVSSKDKSADQPEADFCNSFLGNSERKSVSQCSDCTGWMCMECRDIAYPPTEVHTCANTGDDGDSDAFDRAEKGKQWQECPNPACKIKCGLRDACNFMVCICGAGFCFKCGQLAHHDSDHWMEGKPCPRWGSVDAPNPIFDQPGGPMNFLGFEVAINPREGDLIVLDPEHLLDVNEQLYMDSEEALTLLEELSSEQHFMEDDHGNIPKVILDMKALLHYLRDNMSWLQTDWVLANNMDEHVRPFFANPIEEAVQTINFFMRDEILQANMRESHAAALQVTGEDSVLFTVPVMEIFERYTTVHKPRLVETVKQFVAARDTGRVLFLPEQGQTRRLHRRASV